MVLYTLKRSSSPISNNSVYHVNKIKWFQVLHYIISNSIKHQTFVYIQLNGKTALFQTIQFSISTQFKCWAVLFDPIRCYHSRSEWIWQWRGILNFSELQHYWSLTVRMFSVIFLTLVGELLALYRDALSVFCSPSQLGQWI